MPAAWWSLVINLVVTVLLGIAALLFGWALVEFISSMLGEDVDWRQAVGQDELGTLVLVVAVAMVASVLVSWLFTVIALVLWRLMRGFRTIPGFVQALIAWVTVLVVSTVLSFVGQILFVIFGASTGGSGTY